MQEIKTLDDLKQQLIVPIMFSWNNVVISSIDIEFFDLVQTHSINQTLKILNIQNVSIQFLNFSQLRLLLDVSNATLLDTLLSNVYFNSDLYKTTFHQCNITYNFSDGTKQTLTRYFVIPLISNIIPPTTLIDLNINNGVFNSNILIQEKNLTSISIYIIQCLKYTDISLYNTTLTDMTANYINHSFSITNKDMYEVIVFLIGTYTDKTIKVINWQTIQQTMQLVPVINFTKTGSSVDSNLNTKSIDCMLKIECVVFDGLDYIDYGNIFYRNGFVLSADTVQNPVFQINKTIGLQN